MPLSTLTSVNLVRDSATIEIRHLPPSLSSASKSIASSISTSIGAFNSIQFENDLVRLPPLSRLARPPTLDARGVVFLDQWDQKETGGVYKVK